jgi:hypothetical protein
VCGAPWFQNGDGITPSSREVASVLISVGVPIKPS